MIKVHKESPEYWSATIFNKQEAAEVTISHEENIADFVVQDSDDDLTLIQFDQPDDMRALAYQLIEHAGLLQDRIDISEGRGGDQ